MPELSDLRALTISWLIVAIIAGLAIAPLWLYRPRGWPPQRRRLVGWGGPHVAAALVIFWFMPVLILPLLPPAWRGRVDTIVSGVPMAVLTAAYQSELIDAIFSVLSPEGRYLQYTFTLGGSPVRARRLGLTARRLGTTFGNFPPASVWTYRPIADKA